MTTAAIRFHNPAQRHGFTSSEAVKSESGDISGSRSARWRVAATGCRPLGRPLTADSSPLRHHRRRDRRWPQHARASRHPPRRRARHEMVLPHRHGPSDRRRSAHRVAARRPRRRSARRLFARPRTRPGKHHSSRSTPARRDGLPFLDPAFVHLACRFDLSDGPMRSRCRSRAITSPHPSTRRDAVAFFSLNDRSATGRILDIELRDANDEASKATEVRPGSVLVMSPEPLGFVLVRALAPSPSMRKAIQTELDRSVCVPAN